MTNRLLLAALAFFVVFFWLESGGFSRLGPISATSVSTASDPIATVSATYVPTSGGTKEECKNFRETIDIEGQMVTAEARAIQVHEQEEFDKKCR